MISLLTSLKPFKGDALQLQEKALANWRRLDPTLEIILYGDGEGISERAARFGAKHIPEIRGDEKGVPDFSAIAEHAAQNARYDIQVYLNGDILLPPDFITRIKSVPLKQCLISGQRIDLGQDSDFNPLESDWSREIRRCATAGHAEIHGPAGQDYFVFPRGLWKELAPLIVGRGSYDNALVAFCLRRGIPIVDATWSIHIIHQWHDYSHLKGTTEAKGRTDTLANKRLHDIMHSNPDIEDANWRLTDHGVVPSKGSPNPLRRLEIFLRYRKGLKYPSYVCRAITRAAWLCGWLQPRTLSVGNVLPLPLLQSETL